MHMYLLRLAAKNNTSGFAPAFSCCQASLFNPLLIVTASAATFGQVGEVYGQPPCVVFGERTGRRTPTRLFFEIETGEQMVTTLILILGGVLLAALALIYLCVVRRRQPRNENKKGL
jgi:hypothetical protein